MSRKLLITLALLFIVPLVFAQTPKIQYFVNDYANILSSEQAAGIESILTKIYDSGQAQYAIVIIDSLNGSEIESYSYNLAQGHLGDTGKNNGLLLLIAVNDRQYRFEVGRGLDPILPDIIMGRIGRNYLEPNFKTGDYATGIEEASLAIKDILFNNTESDYYKTLNQQNGQDNSIALFNGLVIMGISTFIFIAVLSVVVFAFIAVFAKKSKKKE